MKKVKTMKKSMRVLIAVLISLMCVNAAMVGLTFISNAETTGKSTQVTVAAKASPSLTASMEQKKATEAKAKQAAALAAKEKQTVKAEPSKTTTAKTSSSSASSKPTTAKTTTTKTTTTTTSGTASGTTTTSPSTTTTTTPTTTTTTTTTNTSTSGMTTLRNSVHSNVLNAFDELEFKIVINPNATYLGYFSTSKHSIEMREATVSTFRHEMGHFLDVLKNMPSRSSEFTAIYNEEKSKYTGTNAAYITKNAQEYFAQSYRNYLESASKLKAERPLTYEFIRQQVNSITSNDITRTYNYYSWAW